MDTIRKRKGKIGIVSGLLAAACTLGRIACSRGSQARSRLPSWTLSTLSCTFFSHCSILCVLCRARSNAVYPLSVRPTSSSSPSRRRGDGLYAFTGRLSRAPGFVAVACRFRHLTIVAACHPIMSSRPKKKISPYVSVIC